MSMDMLASLLQELLKEVRALRSRVDADALPRAVAPEAAAELLGCSVRTLQKEIRAGRIRTVEVAGREHVPITEIRRVKAAGLLQARGVAPARKPRRRTSSGEAGRPSRKGDRGPKDR